MSILDQNYLAKVAKIFWDGTLHRYQEWEIDFGLSDLLYKCYSTSLCEYNFEIVYFYILLLHVHLLTHAG